MASQGARNPAPELMAYRRLWQSSIKVLLGAPTLLRSNQFYAVTVTEDSGVVCDMGESYTQEVLELIGASFLFIQNFKDFDSQGMANRSDQIGIKESSLSTGHRSLAQRISYRYVASTVR